MLHGRSHVSQSDPGRSFRCACGMSIPRPNGLSGDHSRPRPEAWRAIEPSVAKWHPLSFYWDGGDDKPPWLNPLLRAVATLGSDHVRPVLARFLPDLTQFDRIPWPKSDGADCGGQSVRAEAPVAASCLEPFDPVCRKQWRALEFVAFGRMRVSVDGLG